MMWYIYTMEYYSAIKKNESMPFAATRRNLEIITVREENQRKTTYHLYVESNKNDANVFKQTHRLGTLT